MSNELMIKVLLVYVLIVWLKKLIISVFYFINPLKSERATNKGLLKSIEHSNDLINDLYIGVGWRLIRVIAFVEVVLFACAIKVLIGLW